MAARKKEWFDNEAFWREFYPYMFPKERMENAPELAKNILKLAKPKGKAVLDLCCGPARYAVFLAKKGYAVTGVDKSKFLLGKARESARKERVKIEFVCQDMRDFVRAESFNLILSIFTSFGYFDNKREDLLVLRNIFTCLRHGGTFLIDTIGKERLAKIYDPTVSDILPDGTLFVQRHKAIDDWTRMQNEWLLIRNGRVKSFKFHHTIFSGQELRDRLEQTGFIRIKLYGNFKGDEYGPKAQRLIAVAQKPAR